MLDAVTTVAVIGLGRIASSYDIGAPADAAPRSHLGAILTTPGLRLVAVVDPDPIARDATCAQWCLSDEVEKLADVSELSVGVDVAVVCTPSALRGEVLAPLLSKGVKLLLVEKPLALSLAEAREVVDLVEQAGATMRVNFHRRFVPRLIDLRRQLAGCQPRLVVMRYSKGLYNYGSHLIDLMLDWFGPAVEVQAIGAKSNLSFRCGLEAGFDTIVLGLDGVAYDQCEIEIYLSDRRLELVGGGYACEWREAETDRFYRGYAHLGDAHTVAEPEPISGLAQLWKAVSRYPNGCLPGCTAIEALAGIRILEAAQLSAARGGLTLFAEQWP